MLNSVPHWKDIGKCFKIWQVKRKEVAQSTCWTTWAIKECNPPPVWDKEEVSLNLEKEGWTVQKVDHQSCQVWQLMPIKLIKSRLKDFLQSSTWCRKTITLWTSSCWPWGSSKVWSFAKAWLSLFLMKNTQREYKVSRNHQMALYSIKDTWSKVVRWWMPFAINLEKSRQVSRSLKILNTVIKTSNS